MIPSRCAWRTATTCSRDLLSKLLREEEGHVDWLESQVDQIDEIGYERYLITQTEEERAPPPPKKKKKASPKSKRPETPSLSGRLYFTELSRCLTSIVNLNVVVFVTPPPVPVIVME